MNLLAQKIPTEQQIQQIVQTYITNNSTSSGGSSGGGGTTGGAVVLSGTHAERLTSFPASAYITNSLFWETDRTVLYICQFPSLGAGSVWQYALGDMRGLYAARPTDLSTYDSGFLFYATDKFLLYRWSGSSWGVVSEYQPIIQDTHAKRISDFPSTFYPTGTEFWETDRTVLYVCQDVVGTLTAVGTTTQTWVSGDKFGITADWAGKTLTVGGINYTIASVTDPTHVVTTATIPAAVGVDFSVASGKWQYATGQFVCQQATIPADLLSSDDGFLAAVQNHGHILIWQESSLAWTWAPGDDGSGYIKTFAVDPSPTTGWKLCNGGNTTYLKSDGTTVAFTTPDLTGNESYLKLGASYAGTIDPPVIPLISGTTASGNAAISAPTDTGDDSATQTVQAGVGATVPAEPHTHPIGTISDTGHTHGVGSLVNDALGEPQHIVLRPWFRR